MIHSRSAISKNTLTAMLVLMGTAVATVSSFAIHDAHAQAKPAIEKVRAATKNALRQGLTVDLETLEAQARTTHDVLQAALVQVREAELAMTAAAAGSAEADVASEAWIKAQGVAMLAQQDFNLAMRAYEDAKTLKTTTAAAFVEERCTGDDGKDADIARVCVALATAKAEAASKGAAAATGLGPAMMP
jgi:hypothetical protein